MTATRLLMFISCSTLCNVSCVQNAPIETESKVSENKSLDKLVGRISAIYSKENYMLIQKYRNIDTELDVIFYSRSSEGVISSIKLTKQKLGQFYIADLGDGIYSINDPIFMRDLRNNTEVDTNESDTEPYKNLE